MFPEIKHLFPDSTVDDKEVERQRRILDELDKDMGSNTRTTPSEWSRGAASARDDILCTIIGMQNALNSWDDPKQAAYQDVINRIIENFGDAFKPYKL